MRISGLVWAAGCLAGLSAIAGFFGAYWWLFDLASHFRMQYALAFTGAALAALVLRHWRFLTCFIFLSAANLAPIVPLYFGMDSNPALEGPRARVLLLNVHTSCREHERVLALIREQDPDVIVLEEVNARWIKALSGLTVTYTNTVLCPSEDNFGIALYSRLPITDGRKVILGKAGLASIQARCVLGGQVFQILATHVLPPVNRVCAKLRNQQLSEVAEYCRRITMPMALVGDLNASPWSYGFRLVRDGSGLRDSMRGFGVQASWPTHNVFMRIPIDHCLVSDSVRVLNRRIGPATGSDHFPMIFDIELAPAREK